MMPLVLSHLSFGDKLRLELGAVRRFAGDAIDLARMFDQTLAELVDCAKIGAHAFEHDLAIDVHHVSVPDPVMIYHGRHLGARAEFARLSFVRQRSRPASSARSSRIISGMYVSGRRA